MSGAGPHAERLRAMLEELSDVAAGGDESARPVELDQSRVGRLSRMDAMQAQAMSLQPKRRRVIVRQRVLAALQRIENDEFGWCLRCGEAIEPGRLEHDPSLPLCVTCAGLAESR